MASILDFFNGSATPEQNAGLLGFATQILGASNGRQPVNFGQALAAGAQGFQQGRQQHVDREQAQAQLQQLAAMRALQMRAAQNDVDAQERGSALQARIEESARAAAHGGQFDTAAFVNDVRSYDPLTAAKYEQQFAKAAPKFDSGITWVNGADGKPIAVRTAEDGSIKTIDGLAPREKAELVNLGGSSVAVNPFEVKPGQSFQRTVTPDAALQANVAIRGQNMVDRRAAASAPSNKPLPAAALKMQQSELDALSTASGINSDLKRIEGQIEGGKLTFGPVSNLINRGRNAAGLSTEESRNFASFQSTLEKLRNDSLRLNAGVQTDGDAQRAWNELFANINDEGVVKQRLNEIRNINARAAQIRKMNVDGIRANYGHEPLDTSRYENPAPAAASTGGGWKIQRVGD